MAESGPDEIEAQPEAEATPAGSNPRRRPSTALRVLIWLVLLPLLLAGAVVGGGAYAWHWLGSWGERPFGAPGRHALHIPPRTSMTSISLQLEQTGLVEQAQLFKLWIKLKSGATLQAGDYQVETPISPQELVRKLRRGRFGKSITIPEGWTARQIGKRLAKEGIIANEIEWSAAVAAPVAAGTLAEPQPNADGFLFPDTYQLEANTSSAEVREIMLDRFHQKWLSAAAEGRSGGATSATLREVVIVASLLEREARIVEEMPLIASVYYNRLAKQMKLQCCATVFYAMGLRRGQEVWNAPLKRSDLKLDSPYNTYVNKGLPPGPICNPGLPALLAALHPDPSDFLFYVYRGDKRHVFSRNFKDHQAAIAAIREKNPQAALIASEPE